MRGQPPWPPALAAQLHPGRARARAPSPRGRGAGGASLASPAASEGAHPWQPREPGRARRPGGFLAGCALWGGEPALQLRSCFPLGTLAPFRKELREFTKGRRLSSPPPFSVSPCRALGVLQAFWPRREPSFAKHLYRY